MRFVALAFALTAVCYAATELHADVKTAIDEYVKAAFDKLRDETETRIAQATQKSAPRSRRDLNGLFMLLFGLICLQPECRCIDPCGGPSGTRLPDC